MPKVLSLVETAYRATLEEQDDTAIWISYMYKANGGDMDVLLRGNAVNYAVRGQDASGLRFGEWRQTHPPDMARDLAQLMAKGTKVYLVQEDLAERGIEPSEVINGVQPIGSGGLAKLIESYDQVWAF